MLTALLDTPAVGVLDAYQANLYFAGGVDCLLGGYPWSQYVRDSATGLSTEIGFRGQSINQGQLLAHAATGTAMLLNQGSSNKSLFFGTGTASHQPTISSAGSYLGWLEFDGTNDELATPASSPLYFPSVSGATIFMRMKLRSTAATQILLELTPNFNSSSGFVIYYDNSISRLVMGSHLLSPSRYAISEFNVTVTTDAVFCFRFDRSQTTGALQCVLFLNGTKQTRSGSSGETSPVASGNFDAGQIYLASRTTTSLYTSLNLKKFAIYTAALSDSDCAAISALL